MQNFEFTQTAVSSQNQEINEFQILKGMIETRGIVSFAQPIIDLYSGKITGFELLARGKEPFFLPDIMFEKARKLDLSWELEYACRNAALTKILKLSKEFPEADFFINVSPDVFTSSRFQAGFTPDKLKKLGIDSQKIVLEITETTSVRDYRHFEEMIKHYVRQGFRIALDDFGSGHSGFMKERRVYKEN